MHICYSRETLVLPWFPSVSRSCKLCRTFKHWKYWVSECYIWVTIHIFGWSIGWVSRWSNQSIRQKAAAKKTLNRCSDSLEDLVNQNRQWKKGKIINAKNKCNCNRIWVTIYILIHWMGITVIKAPDWTKRKENTKWVFRLLGRPRQSELIQTLRHN